MCDYLVLDISCFAVFFLQAEDGIRDLVRSRGLGDVYKRQRAYADSSLFPEDFARQAFHQLAAGSFRQLSGACRVP